MSLTWHASEANAKASSSAITTSTVYDKLYARLNFNDNDVRAVYIDWGDGDNRLRDEKANYQWKTFDNPVSGAVIEHTYTATGADYTPIIQTVNSEGFVSRYHMDGSNPDSLQLQPFTNNSSITGMAVTDGESTGILRVENKQVLSGIDNSIMEQYGPQKIGIFIPPLVSASDMSTYFDTPGLVLEITAIVDASLGGSSSPAWGASIGAGQSVKTFNWTGSATSTRKGIVELGKWVTQVLKVKFINPKYSGSSRQDDYTVNNVYNNLKIFVVASRVNSAGATKWYPITYVSAGSPIKSVDDSRRYINLDFSQSRAKASNVSNSSYRFDLGKAWFNPAYRWKTVSGSHTSDVNQYFNFNTKTVDSSKKVSYAYNMVRDDGINGASYISSASFPAIAFDDDSTHADWAFSDSQKFRVNQFIIDDFGRFTDQYHLARVTMAPDSQTAYPPTSSASSTVSSLINNKPDVFRITPAISDAAGLDLTKVDYNLGSAKKNYTARYTPEAFKNFKGNLVNLSGMNSMSFKELDGTDRYDNEYFILLVDKPTNKLFFNISNYANNLIYASLSGASFDGSADDLKPWKINGVSYLKIENSGTVTQNAYWKPLQFEDTTKVSREYRDITNKKYIQQSTSLAQSGYISFDMPTDWNETSKIELEKLTGGQFATSTQTSGSFDLLLTGNVTEPTTHSGDYGDFMLLTLNTASENLMTDTFQNGDEVGNYRYIAFIQDTGSIGSAADSLNKPLWVARPESSAHMGWNGSDKLYLTYGKADTNYAPENLTGSNNVKILMRRINIYDVITGVSKVYDKVTGYPPVDATVASWPQTYILSGASGGLSSFGDKLVSAWSGSSNAKYAIKISLSGSSVDVNADCFPNIFNIFDATESHVQVVKEIDDTAYNLCSLGVTSDLSITRTGQYLTAVTKKGRVFIQKTGVGISSLSFSSIATGDTNSTTAFADQGPSSMYGRLHMIRRLQAEGVKVYWDEVQKDGTYVRFWGVVQNLSEVYATGGPTSIKSFTFNMTVTDVALIDANSKLMTDIFPLGGIEDEPTYT